jgi:glutaminase
MTVYPALPGENQSIARLLQSYGRIYFDPAQATDLYTKQCSLNVSAKDLAVMGATLADGGMNPLTRERVVDAMVCHFVLAVMTTAGLYETSGDWLYDIGLARQERDQRRDRHRLSGQGWIGDFRPAVGQRGKQRQGAARSQVPFPKVGNGSVRLGT